MNQSVLPDSIQSPVITTFISSSKPIENADSLRQISYFNRLDSVFKSNISTYDTLIIQEPVNKNMLITERIRQSGKGYKEPQYREPFAEDLVSGILLLVFLLLGITSAIEGKRIKQLYRAMLAVSFANVLKREEKFISHRSSVMLLLAFLLGVSLCVYNGIYYYRYTTDISDKTILFITLFLGFICVYFTKVITVTFLAFVFEQKELASNYIFNLLLFNIGSGVLLFPILVLYTYTLLPKEIVLMVSFTMIAFFISYRTIRNIYMSIQQGAVMSYIFLYFCALEFLPLMVLIKLLIAP